MARAQVRQRNKKNNASPVATIQAFTDSAERIGVDAAFYGTLAVLGFGALAFGAHAGAVFGLTAILVVGWSANKFLHAYFALRKAQLKLEAVRQERGYPLLSSQRDRLTAISPPNGDHDHDTRE